MRQIALYPSTKALVVLEGNISEKKNIYIYNYAKKFNQLATNKNLKQRQLFVKGIKSRPKCGK